MKGEAGMAGEHRGVNIGLRHNLRTVPQSIVTAERRNMLIVSGAYVVTGGYETTGMYLSMAHVSVVHLRSSLCYSGNDSGMILNFGLRFT